MIRRAIDSLFVRRSGEIEALNGARAVSLALVVFFHFWDILARMPIVPAHSPSTATIFDNFRFGVDLFFILSGFLISAGLKQEWLKMSSFSLKNFLIRRGLRIFPAYYFFLAFSVYYLYSQLNNAAPPGVAAITDDLERLLFDVFFISNYFRGPLPHSWSLAVEEQFYLIFPLLAYFLLFRINSQLRLLLLCGLYLLPLFFRILYYASYGPDPHYGFIYFAFHTRCDALLMGIIIMEIHFEWRKMLLKRFNLSPIHTANVAFLVGVVILIYAHLLGHPHAPWLADTLRYNLINIGYGLLLFAVLEERFTLNSLFTAPIFRPLARLSYTGYLWQFVAFTHGARYILSKTSGELEWATVLLAYLVGMAVLLIWSALLYLVIEYPFLQLKKRFNESQIALLRKNGSETAS